MRISQIIKQCWNASKRLIIKTLQKFIRIIQMILTPFCRKNLIIFHFEKITPEQEQEILRRLSFYLPGKNLKIIKKSKIGYYYFFPIPVLIFNL